MLERESAVLATVFLGVGGLCTWIAALMPQLFPVWFNREPLTVISQNLTAWNLNASLFLAGAVATLVGCAFALPIGASPMSTPTLLVLAMATTLWVLDLSLRLSVIPSVASQRSAEREAWLDPAQSWSTAAWYVAAGCLILAFCGIGAIVLTTGILDAWVGWVCLASALFSAVVFVVTRDMAPVVVYLPVIPLGVATLLVTLRTPMSAAT